MLTTDSPTRSHAPSSGRQSEGLRRLRRTEGFSILRQATLLARDLRPVVPGAGQDEDVVVLIHGFMASAGVFRPMRARIERETMAVVASFTHAPGARVRSIAADLARLVERLPRESRVHLVGHSLGGLAARWYVQELGGHARVKQTVSLATPFGGAPAAERFPFFVGADLFAGSALLSRLRDTAHVGGVPHTSIVGVRDTTVGSVARGRFHHGDVIVLGAGHNALLFDDEAIGHVVARIKAS